MTNAREVLTQLDSRLARPEVEVAPRFVSKPVGRILMLRSWSAGEKKFDSRIERDRRAGELLDHIAGNCRFESLPKIVQGRGYVRRAKELSGPVDKNSPVVRCR